MSAIDACELALTACANDACNLRVLECDGRMSEGASIDADAYRRHFLLLAPRNSLAVIIVALETLRFLTTRLRNYLAVVSYNMVLQTTLVAAAAINFFLKFLPTWQLCPLTFVNESYFCLFI